MTSQNNTLIYFRKEYLETLVKTLLDIIILSILNGESVHGYKIIAEIHKTFGVLLSPGTLYPLLYSLHDEHLVKVKKVDRRKLYSLTTRGRERVFKINKLYKKNSEMIFRFIDENLQTVK